MPIDSRHPHYADRRHEWQVMRDVIEGEDAVKGRGTEYLPRPMGATDTGYQGYLRRASFHEATTRTVQGLLGLVFRKPPTIDGVPPESSLLSDATGEDDPFETLAKEVTHEVIALARVGVLVDVPASGGMPYARTYAAESIINWRHELIAGRKTLTLVVLEETVLTDGDDEFALEEAIQWRVLRLVEDGGELVYQQEVWRKEKTAGARDQFVLIEAISPTRAGARLTSIPFQFIGTICLDGKMERAPLYGLALVNLSHYRTAADLEHGAHWTALPTPVVIGELAGQQDEDGAPQQLHIGSGTAWQIEAGGDAKMLEYNGQGLSALEQRLERKEKHMAVLGARLLEDQKAGVEAHQTVALRHRGESSVLANIADTVSRGLTNVLNWMNWWAAGGENAATVTLNSDFFEARLEPQQVMQAISAWQQGGYGTEVLFHILKSGEVLPDDMDYDAFVEDMTNNGAAAVGMTFDVPGIAEADDEGAEGEDEGNQPPDDV